MAAKILVIDDSSIVRNLHSAMLNQAGFEVGEAVDGVDALEQLAKSEYDLLLVDVNMPRMDGISLCKEVRNDKKHQETPIIIISTKSESEDRMTGFKAGANLYLIKPIKAEALIENVKMLLN